MMPPQPPDNAPFPPSSARPPPPHMLSCNLPLSRCNPASWDRQE